MNNPLVSVIMPAYNAEKWIAEAIDSILNQTYENIELLIYDDGSTDLTDQVLFDSYITDSIGNIMLFAGEENRGITFALNYLIEKAQGKYIARMDADDIAMPDRIKRQVHYLDAFPVASACGTTIELFGDENKNKGREKWWGNFTIRIEEHRKILPYRNPICHPSVMFRAEILKEYMYEGKGAFQDYDLFLRMGSDGHMIGKVDETLLRYRVRADSEAAVNESNKAEIKLKINFLIKKFPRWNKFDTHVMRSIWQIMWR